MKKLNETSMRTYRYGWETSLEKDSNNLYLKNKFSKSEPAKPVTPEDDRDKDSDRKPKGISINKDTIQDNIDFWNDYLDKCSKSIDWPAGTPETDYKKDVDNLYKKYLMIVKDIAAKILQLLFEIRRLDSSATGSFERKKRDLENYYRKLYDEIDEANEKLSQINRKYSTYAITKFSFPKPPIRTISLTESNFIFGDTRNIIEDVINLEEAASYKTINGMNGHISSLEKEKNDLIDKQRKTGDPRLTQEISNVKMELSQQKATRIAATQDAKAPDKKDPLVMEAFDPTAGLERRKENLEAQKKRENDQHKAKTEGIEQQIEKIDMAIDSAKAKDNNTAQQAPTTLGEGENINSKNHVEKDEELKDDAAVAEKTEPANETLTESVSKYESMLFNGYSGDALKYFIRGEINNTNMTEIGIARFIEEDKETKDVIKTIKYLLKKLSRCKDDEESYKMYIELKVQKNKFRTLFTQGRHRIEKQYKK